MKLYPLSNRVVVKIIESKEKTRSGIIIVSDVKEKTQVAEIIAIAENEKIDCVTEQIKIGDKIVFNKDYGTEIKIGEDIFVVLNKNDILALLK